MVLERNAMRAHPPKTPPTIAASCGLVRSVPIAPVPIWMGECIAGTAVVDTGTATVVALSGWVFFEDELMGIVVGALSKKLVSMSMPMELDFGPDIEGRVARNSDAVEVDDMDAWAKPDGTLVPSGELTLVEVGTVFGKLGERDENMVVLDATLVMDDFLPVSGKRIVDVA
jgi:hypothetical protein